MMVKSQKNCTLCVLVIFFVSITVVVSGKVPIKKRSLVVVGGGDGEPSGVSELKLRPNKRTFCNAFTGCGKKRSDGTMPVKPQPDYEYDQRDLSTDNSEDSIDDVARDILAEARLYEALQARNSMRLSQNRRPGFFPRQKRSPTVSHDEMKAVVVESHGRPSHISKGSVGSMDSKSEHRS